MEVIFNVTEGILVAAVKGEIDHHTAAPLRNDIDRTMKELGCRHLILDLEGVGFMDSSGIGVALGRYKKLTKSGGQLCISGCSEYIDRVLDMAGVFSIIHKAKDVEEAVAVMGGEEQLRMEV